MGSEALPKMCWYKFDTFMVSLETPKGVIKTLERCHIDTFLIVPQNPKWTSKKVSIETFYFSVYASWLKNDAADLIFFTKRSATNPTI